jgi:exonuclease III
MPRNVRELREFVSKFSPAILCIQETQISKACTEALTTSLGFDCSFAIGSDGRSAGLGMYCNIDLTISDLGYSKYHIDVSVVGFGESEWRLTIVYGEAQVNE